MLQRIKLFYVRFWLRNLLMLLFLVGCQNRHFEMISTDKLALAELSPQLHFEQELMIARVTQVLSESKLSPHERAHLFFERGILYDSLGLWTLARYDFSQAIEIVPSMESAYNYLGLYWLLEGDYDGAIDAFNTVLALDPDYNYGYFNRGLAFYYAGNYSAAEQDLLRFYSADKQDPYGALWLYFNELEFKPAEAKANLMTRSKSLSETSWGTQIVHYFLDQISLIQLRQKIDKGAQPNTAQYAENLTETYFYLAKQKLKINQIKEAISLFRLATANQMYNFVEYRFAQFELLQLRNKQINPVVVGKN